MRRSTVLLASLFLAVPAFATTTTYDWSGQVTSPNWKVSLNELVHGTVEVDDQGPEVHREPDVAYYQAVRFTFEAGGEHFSSGDQRTWGVTDTRQGFDDGYLTQGSPVYFSFSWNVETRQNPLDLFAAKNLDQEWLSGYFGMQVSDPDHGYFADSFEGKILSLARRGGGGDATPTPEPSAFILMGTGLLGFGALRFRRQNPPTSRLTRPSKRGPGPLAWRKPEQ